MNATVDFHLAREERISGCEKKAKFNEKIEFNRSNILRAADFGAVGNGTTDDSAAVQAAIVECLQNGGGTVIFAKNKRYKLNTVFVGPGVTLRGYGATIVEPDKKYYFHRWADDNLQHLGADSDERVVQLLALYDAFSWAETGAFVASIGYEVSPPAEDDGPPAGYIDSTGRDPLRARAAFLLALPELTEQLLYEMFGQVNGCRHRIKWSRIFTTAAPFSGSGAELVPIAGLIHYRGDNLSEPLVIKGFCFEGAGENLGPHGGYQLQQKHLIYLTAHRKSRGRLVAYLRDLSLTHSAGDGISVVYNTKVHIRNVIATDTFRGAVTATGGNSVIDMADLKTQSINHRTGINLEVNSGSFVRDGALSNHAHRSIYVTADRLELDANFDLELLDYSRFDGRNIVCTGGPFHINAPHQSQVRISDSKFVVGQILQDFRGDPATSQSSEARVLRCNDCVFDNVAFLLDFPKGPFEHPVKILTGLLLSNNDNFFQANGQSVTFRNCGFQMHSPAPDAVEVRAISSMRDDAGQDNRYLFDACNFGRQMDYGVSIGGGGGRTSQNAAGTVTPWGRKTGGGNWSFTNCNFHSDTGIFAGSSEPRQIRSSRMTPPDGQLVEIPVFADANGDPVEQLFGEILTD